MLREMKQSTLSEKKECGNGASGVFGPFLLSFCEGGKKREVESANASSFIGGRTDSPWDIEPH